MNLYILFLVSLPETVLNIILILLFAGEKRRLKINGPNIIRLFITLVAMLLSSKFIRPIAPNVEVNMILHVTAYIIIIMLVYRVKLQYALLSVGFTLLIYTTVENAYIPYIIAYVSKGMENFVRDYFLFPIYALPNRICQVLVIWFMWKHEILLVTKINQRFHNTFIATTFILIFIEYFFVFIFCTYFGQMSLPHQVGLSIALCAMVIIFNLLVFRLLYNAVGGIVRKGYEQYSELEKNAIYAFDEIQNMLKANNVTEAIKLIDELKGNDDIKIQ